MQRNRPDDEQPPSNAIPPQDQEYHGRIPWLTPGELDEHQRRLYEKIVGNPGASSARPTSLPDSLGRFHGPFNALLLDPVVGEAVQDVGARLRFSTDLGDRMREIAILVTAASARSNYEWHIHAAIARTLGLEDGDLASILRGSEPERAWRVSASYGGCPLS